MSGIHDPRTWHWHEGIPESLRDDLPKSEMKPSAMPDRRPAEMTEEDVKKALAEIRSGKNGQLSMNFEKNVPPHTPLELTDDAL